MKLEDTRWSICYGAEGIWIEPVENSCRTYGCCGGTDCGFTASEAQQEIVDYHQRQADFWKAMSLTEFLETQGYRDDPRDTH